MDIFSWAQDMVMGFLGDWLNKITGIQDLVLNPIAQIAKNVLGGSVWKGRGADKFVAELEGNTKNELSAVQNIGNAWSKGVKQASDTIFQSMQTAQQMANSLYEIFDGI